MKNIYEIKYIIFFPIVNEKIIKSANQEIKKRTQKNLLQIKKCENKKVILINLNNRFLMLELID